LPPSFNPFDFGDSCNNTNIVETSVIKIGIKRRSGSLESPNVIEAESGEESITKSVKMVRVKTEPKD